MSRSHERVVVSHVGKVPARLSSAFSSTELLLEHVNDPTDIKSSTRAVVASFVDFKTLALLKSRIEYFFDNGIALIVVEKGDEFARAQTMFGVPELMTVLTIKEQEAKLLPISIINSMADRRWAKRIALICRTHEPGRSQMADFRPIISKEDGVTLSASQEKLLQRAFEDYESIRIGSLPTGYSGAEGPWRVRPSSIPRSIDFVVKLDNLARARTEIDTVRDMCGEKIGFPFYAPIMRDRCVTNSRRRAVVSGFVDRAILFEDYIATNSPKIAIASLFDGPLGLWRKIPIRRSMEFGKYSIQTIFGGEESKLVDAFKTAKSRGVVLEPAEMLSTIAKVKALDVNTVMAHGDLHLRNIFIRHHSADIVLIDFSKCSEQPACCDPATLDVSLGFDIPGKDAFRTQLSDDVRTQLYMPPFFGRPLKMDWPRVEAIEAVRAHATTLSGEMDYGLAVTGTLLWRASKFRDGCAYQCASNIVSELSAT